MKRPSSSGRTSPWPSESLADFYVRNHDFQRATPLIERLLSGEKCRPAKADLVSARRMKASILLATQDYSKLKEATELIDRNLASPLALSRTNTSRFACSWPIPVGPAVPICSNWRKAW